MIAEVPPQLPTVALPARIIPLRMASAKLAIAPPVLLALFPEKVLLVTFSVLFVKFDGLPFKIPPPLPPPVVLLPEKVQFVIVTLPSKLAIAPPSPPPATLPEKVVFVTDSVPVFPIPPPRPAAFPEKVLLMMVNAPV